ncbi:MAG: PD-(D/E)XK nuclease family protein, partial [Acidobacteria bacterium]
EPDSARVRAYERDLRNLAHLRAFALPVIDELAEWPDRAMWGEWLDRFSALAVRCLSRPERVLQTLAAYRPMSEVGPVSLEEAGDALKDRLVALDWDPPDRRYGRVFVGTPHQARGRAFRVVFVPGLAERLVPQRPREDPLLLDEQRAEADEALVRQDDRRSAERLLLKIAIGAASERLYLSYPRMDVAETRARVPSFYALDVMRAITGRVPDHRVLAAEAEEEAGARLEWPAPRDSDRAIDELEHDLAVLKPLLESRDTAVVKGRAHYLLGLNDALRRSVIGRWARGRPAWSPSDGLVKVAPGVRDAIQANRLGGRAYSLSALQRFSVCPYQFLLAAIHRLEPRDEPEPLVRMDPLTRGSLFHKVQAEFFRALERAGALPVTPDGLPGAIRTLDAVLDRVADSYAEQLLPAIPRVWQDEVAEIRRDLGIWVRRLADDQTWVPTYFEFSFGLNDEGRDPRSLPDPVVVDGRFVLRGSVDLVETRPDLGVLRVTDHKTGKDRTNRDIVVGGGAVLQPVLYSVAVEQGLGTRVVSGRLFYCTTAGGFAERPIEVNDYSKGQALRVLELIDSAVERGFLVAAPAERACTWCDFRPVCGPHEEDRVKRTNKAPIRELEDLRSLR